MPVTGTSKLTRLQLAQLNVDLTKTPAAINVVMALIDPESGHLAYMKHNGSIWSEATQSALRQLIDSLEHDVARVVLLDAGGDGVTKPAQRQTQAEGLGEHLTGADVPDM
mgnify:CR=1 FL=1|jgi:hypothetical protein